MTTQKSVSHIDDICQAEKEAQDIVAQAEKKRAEKISQAKADIANEVREYREAFQSVKEKRLLTQKNDLEAQTRDIVGGAVKEAQDLEAHAMQNREKAVAAVVNDILTA